MSRITVNFTKLIQDSQDYGSDDEHMVSRAFFTIAIDDNNPVESHVNIKQIVGSDFETAPLEISTPNNYKGPFDFEAFSKATESYYRSLVGSLGSVIHISGGSNVRMRNNTFIQQNSVSFEAFESGSGW